MTNRKDRILIDAGPSLNFFACNQERLLLKTVGALAMPETVRDEIVNKARQTRFAPAKRTLDRLPESLLQILCDDATPEMTNAVFALQSTTLQERSGRRKDLGELMVISHGFIRAKQGMDVTLMIDDQQGQRLAMRAANIICQLKANNPAVGSLGLTGTIQVLEKAARRKIISSKNEMRALYERMRLLDDGLVHIDQTGLLRSEIWDRQ